MNQTPALEPRVVELLARMLDRPAAELSPDKQLVRDLGVGSVDLLGLVSGLEEEFDIVLPSDGSLISSIRTVRELVALVEEYQTA